MAQPSPYNRVFNFSNYQAENPASPVPATQLDAEFSRIKAVTDQIRAVIAALQRDDLALANSSVGYDQLKSEISIGVNPPTTWATSTNYVERDSVFHEQKFYVALESHVSGTFATDLTAEKWELVADFTAAQTASLVTYDNTTSGLTATDMQAAMDELVASVIVTSVFGRAGAVVATTSDYDAVQIDFDPTGRTHTDAVDVQEAIADLDAAVTVAAASVPTGTVLDWAGSAAPTGYLLCYGQTVSRTTYADLFAVVGTAYGAGDGSTTFALPDLRGRAVAGKDDMGGVSANRLTNQTGGLNGDTLGATGGTETHTLTEAQMPAHTHTVSGTTSTDGAHTHGIATSGGGAGTIRVRRDSGSFERFESESDGDHSHTVTGTAASTGSGSAHNNVQPTLILNKIIKT